MTNIPFPITSSEDGLAYDFVFKTKFQEQDIIITKRILFEPMNLRGNVTLSVINLSLTDYMEDGEFSDSARTGYGKEKEILSVVGECLLRFFKLYPDETVFFTGSDNSRTRLYRMMLSNEETYRLVTENFDLFGISKERGVFEYKPNDKCTAFLIEFKK